MSNNTNILKKMVLARSIVGKISKDGTHGTGYGSYQYMTDETISHRVRTAFMQVGIVPAFKIKLISKENFENSKGTRMTSVVVSVDCEFYDEDSGEFIVCSGIGEASDSSDKGVTKAITSAIKYIYIKTFTLSTKDDIEMYDADVDCDEQPAVIEKLVVKSIPKEDISGDGEKMTTLSDKDFNAPIFTNALEKYLSDNLSPKDILKRIKVKYILTPDQEATILNLK